MTPRQGEIWWSDGRNKRRPVLIVTRTDVIPALHWITVAPLTRTIRGIPTEIAVDERDGLRDACVASFDNLTLAPAKSLTTRIADSSPSRRAQICRALSALADC